MKQIASQRTKLIVNSLDEVANLLNHTIRELSLGQSERLFGLGEAKRILDLALPERQ